MKEQQQASLIREPAEVRHAKELEALKHADEGSPRPPNWQLSPRKIIDFITGTDEPVGGVPISRKFYGDDVLVQRAVASLASERALMLIGEPGTAKSWLSEHLSAAISGTSLNTIQGSAAVTEDQIKYSWNYALLLTKGPSRESLVPAPLLTGLEKGEVVRFEEITRCPPEIQDVLLSVLSDKVITIPELDAQGTIFARKGFGLIATANTRDRGVNEMSSALKRRMNFETIQPLNNIDVEMDLVSRQVSHFLEGVQIRREVPQEVIELLTTTFSDLRSGRTSEGEKVDRLLTATMSTAECVETGINAAVYSHYIEDRPMTPEAAAINLRGTIIKDNLEDLKKLQSYFNLIVKKRTTKHWKKFYSSSRTLFS